MTASSLSPARRRSIALSIGLLVFVGVADLGRWLFSETSDGLGWIPPFAFWGIAFRSWQRYLKPKT